MATKRAKTLTDAQYDKLIRYVKRNATLPERDVLIMALSFKAGLRIAEIQKLDLDAMLDVEGNIDSNISIFSHVAKRNRERCIPMHPSIRAALQDFMDAYPNAAYVAISSQPFRWLVEQGRKIPKNSKFKRMSVTALTNYYKYTVINAGFKGASSHSGRRTFATGLAQKANQNHCSIRDVQRLLGHSRLDSTECYLEISQDARGLVAAL